MVHIGGWHGDYLALLCEENERQGQPSNEESAARLENLQASNLASTQYRVTITGVLSSHHLEISPLRYALVPDSNRTTAAGRASPAILI